MYTFYILNIKAILLGKREIIFNLEAYSAFWRNPKRLFEIQPCPDNEAKRTRETIKEFSFPLPKTPRAHPCGRYINQNGRGMISTVEGSICSRGSFFLITVTEWTQMWTFT